MISKIVNLSVVGVLTFTLMLGVLKLAPFTLSREDIVNRYHELAYSNPANWDMKWLGVSTTQNPNDVWIIQEIITELKPDYIIETGTDKGGSAAIWAMLQREVNPDGRVITIDIRDLADRNKIPLSLRERIDFVIGSSVDPVVVSNVASKVQGGNVLVLLDSNHEKSHVLRELELYSPLVRIGSYVIVQDTDVNGHPVLETFGPGPMEAIDQFLARSNQFQIDPSREKLLFTMHPKGYLKRVR